MSPALAWAVVCVLGLWGATAPSTALGQGYKAEGQTTRNAVSMMPKGVGITENLGGQIDPGLTFTDDTGKTVTLGDYLNRGKPV
ncbi:MAG: hypothetical protein ACYTGQ_20165, partial [Planctomycetota bacterium]